ncbi:MAG: DMT family transporter [Solirubrobacterales bacterium]
MTERARRRTAAIVAVSATTVVWGSVGVFVKTTSISGLTFAMYRLWLGAAVHVVALLVLRRRLTWSTFKVCAPGGVLFAMEISLSFSAVKLTAVANAAIIGALSPILIVLAAGRMFGERVTREQMVLVVASFAGVVIVAIGASGSPAWSPAGDLLALVGSFAWTAYWLFSKRARASASALEYMTSVMLVGALAITPVALAIGGVPPASLDIHDAVVLAGLTLVPGMIGHLLLAWSHRHVEAWLSALITQCVPVIGALMAWPVLGEPITPIVALGGLVVVGATGAIVVSSARRERDRAQPSKVEPVIDVPA